MKLFQTEQEKKSLVITVTSFTLLFLLFFLLKFSDSLPLPEMEGGGGGGEIAVNFGDSEFGSGENFDSKEVVRADPDKAEDSPTEEKEIIVSENEEAPAVVEVKKPDTKIEKKAEEKQFKQMLVNLDARKAAKKEEIKLHKKLTKAVKKAGHQSVGNLDLNAPENMYYSDKDTERFLENSGSSESGVPSALTGKTVQAVKSVAIPITCAGLMPDDLRTSGTVFLRTST